MICVKIRGIILRRVVNNMEEYKLKNTNKWKKFFDIAISIFIIIATLLIMLIISVLIKLDSKGKVIYKQKRITKQGK